MEKILKNDNLHDDQRSQVIYRPPFFIHTQVKYKYISGNKMYKKTQKQSLCEIFKPEPGIRGGLSASDCSKYT